MTSTWGWSSTERRWRAWQRWRGRDQRLCGRRARRALRSTRSSRPRRSRPWPGTAGQICVWTVRVPDIQNIGQHIYTRHWTLSIAYEMYKGHFSDLKGLIGCSSCYIFISLLWLAHSLPHFFWGGLGGQGSFFVRSVPLYHRPHSICLFFVTIITFPFPTSFSVLDGLNWIKEAFVTANLLCMLDMFVGNLLRMLDRLAVQVMFGISSDR